MPIATARTTNAGSSLTLSMTILAAGSSLRIRRVNSKPVRSGSTYVYHGDVGMLFCRYARWPSFASEASNISTEESEANKARQPVTTTGWSSTISIRMSFGPSLHSSVMENVPSAGKVQCPNVTSADPTDLHDVQFEDRDPKFISSNHCPACSTLLTGPKRRKFHCLPYHSVVIEPFSANRLHKTGISAVRAGDFQ